jgi:hypothetical protein
MDTGTAIPNLKNFGRGRALKNADKTLKITLHCRYNSFLLFPRISALVRFQFGRISV